MESAAQRKHRVATNGFSDTASDSLTLDTPLGNSSALSNACPDAKADAATLTAAEPTAVAAADSSANAPAVVLAHAASVAAPHDTCALGRLVHQRRDRRR